MKVKKLTDPSICSKEEYEQEFIEFMGEAIRAYGIDPEEVPRLMWRVYRDEFELTFVDHQ